MTTILVLGGTGPTGQLLVHAALAGGHTVTVVARRPERLAVEHSRLRKVACDVTADVSSLRQAAAGQDLVICTLGHGLGLRGTHLIERSMANLVPVLEAQGPRRIVLMSAFGVGASFATAPLLLRIVFATLLSSIYADKARGENLLRRSSLDWTILQPVQLTNAKATGRYEIGDSLPAGGVPRIARADVAAALLGSALDPTTIRRTLVVHS
jgi:putative NADH-flavin reductase